jgi:hypothetical protein
VCQLELNLMALRELAGVGLRGPVAVVADPLGPPVFTELQLRPKGLFCVLV